MTSIKSIVVTKRKLIEEALVKAKEDKELELEKAKRIREEFFKGYPHYNIGNPPQ